MGKWEGPEEKRHKLTKKDQKYGGKAKSEIKTLQNRRKNIKYCTAKCDIYPCPYEPMSYKEENVIKKGKKEFRLCVVKKLPTLISNRVMKILEPTEENIRSVLTELLTELSIHTAKEDTRQGTKDMMDYTIKFHDTIFGKKTRSEVTGEMSVGKYTPEDIQRFYKLHKERKR